VGDRPILYHAHPRNGTIPERSLQKRLQMTFDPDFRRLPRRCRHNRNPVDDRAQCLRSTFVPVSKIASDQLIQGLAAFRGRVSREAAILPVFASGSGHRKAAAQRWKNLRWRHRDQLWRIIPSRRKPFYGCSHHAQAYRWTAERVWHRRSRDQASRHRYRQLRFLPERLPKGRVR
jgi:hypothetical protein